MSKKKTSLLSKGVYHTLRFFAKIRYRKMKVIGIENIPKTNTVIVANHAQLNGPIIAELFMPKDCYIWANGQMVDSRDVPSYAMEDFFPYKKGVSRVVFKLASYVLAPLLPCVINNARTIPVYHDARIVSTFRNTLKKLAEGKNILIFPECHQMDNNIVNRFQEDFIEVARLYYKRTGISLRFIPMYVAPKLNRCYFGKEIMFDATNDIKDEKHRIAQYLSGEITRLGRSIPEHTVIPFDNISSKLYISNKDIDYLPGEKITKTEQTIH